MYLRSYQTLQVLEEIDLACDVATECFKIQLLKAECLVSGVHCFQIE